MRNTPGVAPNPLVIYVDVDDTLVHAVGDTRIPMPRMVEHVRQLREKGATLYCWSTGGAGYARATAVRLGIDHCFEDFLPKPNVILDDLALQAWRQMIEVHPFDAVTSDLADYRRRLGR
jgi:predicted HAD superfamily phosphohydrolase YqeG